MLPILIMLVLLLWGVWQAVAGILWILVGLGLLMAPRHRDNRDLAVLKD